MANTVHGPFVKGASFSSGSYGTGVGQSNTYTSGNANNDETQSAVALHSFNPYHVAVAYVLSGVACSKDASTATQLDITAGEAVVKMTDGTFALIDVVATTESASGHPSTTLYLDLNPDGTWSFATTHSGQTNYLPICQVTTDGSSNILTVTDERQINNFIFNSQTGGMVTPAPLYTPVTQVAADLATVVGGVTFGQQSLLSSSMDGAALFNGSTGYLSFPTAGLPTGNSAWSIEAWFKTSYSGASQVILFAGSPSAKEAMWLYLDTAGHVIVDLYTSTLTSSASGYNNGARHHAVVTWDGTNATIYVDGTQVGTSATLGPDAITYTYGLIGVYNTGSAYAAYFNGTLDEVAIYSVTLSSARVTAHYNAGVSITTDAYAAAVETDSPLRYYRLGDFVGSAVAVCSQAAVYHLWMDPGQSIMAAGNISAGNALTSLGGQASAGSFGAPVIVAQALNTAVTTAGDHVILSYAPAANGLYRINGYLEMQGSAAGAILARVTYGDDLGTPSAFMALASVGATTPTLLNGGTSFGPSLSGNLFGPTIFAKTGTNIICHYDSPNGTPNDHVWFLIERLA